MLTIVATPIGNLKDITLRSIEALQECDAIVCEDTRRASVLLNQYNIRKPLLILNDFNESRHFPAILDRLRNEEKLCLISDAGTPLISDPGYKLVRQCLKEGILVNSLPGPSSVITALTLSTLPPNNFMFIGYFPDKPSHRTKTYENLQRVAAIAPATFIFFIAPFKIAKTFAEMLEVMGDVEMTLAKELTKIHQSIRTQKLSEWIKETKKTNPRGEYVGLVYLPQSLNLS